LYAYETVGNYKKSCFFNSSDADELAQLMKDLIENKIIFAETDFKEPQQPFSNNWEDLFSLLLK